MKVYKKIRDYYPKELFRAADENTAIAIFKISEMDKWLRQSHYDNYAKPHLRSFFEICIAYDPSEQITFEIGSRVVSNTEGHLLFVSPTQTFSVSHTDQHTAKPTKGIIIAFTPAFLTHHKGLFDILYRFRFFRSQQYPQHLLKHDRLQYLLQIAENMYEEYRNEKYYADAILRSYLELLLYHCNRWLILDEYPEKTSASEYLSIQLEQEIIKDGNKIKDVASYAARCNVTANYLSESVKKSTGKTAKEVLLEHKLIVAKNLLQQKHWTIAEIAFEMDFSQATNFTKFFKQMTGLSPMQYRKEMRP